MREFAEIIKELQERLKNAGGCTIIITENDLKVEFSKN